jgi:alpha-tubulin suppressor-like RCC1 family protein
MILRSVLALSLILTTCQDSIGPLPQLPTAIGLVSENHEQRVLHLGDTARVRAYRLDRQGLPIIPDTVRFVWESSDTTVLAVDTGGHVTVVGLGEAEVIARLRDINVDIPSPYDTASGRLKFAGMYTVVDPGPVLSATMGEAYMCVVRTGGQAYCRGDNQHGSLGDGTQVFRNDWTPVAGGHSFTSITAGDWHTCALTADGRAFCWGRAHHGQAGNGRTVPWLYSIPNQVIGNHRWSWLDAGGHGATCLIKADDQVPYCFGHNDGGQVGREPIVGSDSVVGPIHGSHRMREIHTSHFFTCGLEVDGAVYCSGERGPPTNTPWPPQGSSYIGIPTRIGGAEPLTTISIGDNHGCGLNAAGAAFCWGWGFDGELGDGPSTSSGTLRPAAAGMIFRSIHAFHDASCGITTAGELRCWGGNAQYVFGRTSNPRTPVPLRVKVPPLRWIWTGDETVEQMCAITQADQFICWGGGY